MNQYTAAAWVESAEGKMTQTASEIMDNRFAVIAERMFEVVSFNDCEDGANYDVLYVSDVPDCFAPDHAVDQRTLTEVYVWKNEPNGYANVKMLDLMRERISERF